LWLNNFICDEKQKPLMDMASLDNPQQ